MCPTACAKAHPHQGCLKFPVKNNLGPYRAEQTTGAVHIALRDVVDHLNEQSEDLVGRWVVRCMVCVCGLSLGIPHVSVSQTEGTA